MPEANLSGPAAKEGSKGRCCWAGRRASQASTGVQLSAFLSANGVLHARGTFAARLQPRGSCQLPGWSAQVPVTRLYQTCPDCAEQLCCSYRTRPAAAYPLRG